MSLGYISLLADLTIIDTVNFSQRTVAFGQLSGWSQLGAVGGMASTVIGGIIFTIFSSFKGIFMATALLLAACVGCAWALLFEQNPRNKLAMTSKETRDLEPIASSWKLAVTSISGIMDILRPRRSPVTGKHNWRILLCCIYEVMFSIGGAWMASSESIVKRLTKHNQLIVKAIVVGASIFFVSLLTLLVFIPLVIKYRTRAIYARTPRRIAPALPGSKRIMTGTVVDAVDGLNVNIAITSMIAQVISLVILGLSSSWTAQMIG
ncbi:hypothetical protein WOLCODRAFT_140267 [Wolfiporia cocos MD-104 SS10]|uniref:MFS general substrate transporter n=1 Tax=Wolfiporia cocos (strain MD-104) TaxID=742152 RepID=A0A2H3JEV7_WOLCO|nr:hypothetical protein WOLCODRAFT_140267 [Wolfiporia cocos MD-104 SS10]